jgi:hypothetical protein
MVKLRDRKFLNIFFLASCNYLIEFMATTAAFRPPDEIQTLKAMVAEALQRKGVLSKLKVRHTQLD